MVLLGEDEATVSLAQQSLSTATTAPSAADRIDGCLSRTGLEGCGSPPATTNNRYDRDGGVALVMPERVPIAECCCGGAGTETGRWRLPRTEPEAIPANATVMMVCPSCGSSRGIGVFCVDEEVRRRVGADGPGPIGSFRYPGRSHIDVIVAPNRWPAASRQGFRTVHI